MTKARDTANLTGSGVTLPLLDIDAGTDIGAALVDADLMIVDDGAGGTNRKATMSRLATYMGTKIGGGLEFIASTDVSNAATASFTGFDSSKYDSYLFTCANIVPATDDADFAIRMSIDNGSNYLSASDSYFAGSPTDADASYIPLMYSGMGNVSTEGASLNVKVHGPHLNTCTYAFADGVYSLSSGNLAYNPQGGKTKIARVVDAVQFLFHTGNIASGTITMYGFKDA